MPSRSHDIRGSRTLILALVAATTAACGVADDPAVPRGLELEAPEWSSSMPASTGDGSTTGWDMGAPGDATTWWDSDDSSPGSGGCDDFGCGSATGSDFGGGGTGSGGTGGESGSGESSSAGSGGTDGESSSAGSGGTGGESSGAASGDTGGESSSAEGSGSGGESSSADGSGSDGESGGGETGGTDDTGGESGGGETGGVTGDGDSGSGDTGDQCALVSSEFAEHVFLEGTDHADGELPQEYPPGWAGRRPLPTPTECNHQFWIDSDGVAPETPGCHQEYTKDCAEKAKGLFGEACDDADQLVETNPGAGVCHGHKNGIGNPDIFSCNHYCLVKYEKTGSCQVTKDTCGVGIDSAYCRCDFNDPT